MRAIKMLVAAVALSAAVSSYAQPVQLLHPTNATWRYLADGSDQGTAWQGSGFDDSTWPQGKGLFGNDTGYPYGFNTALPGATPINVYYRGTFNWSGSTIGVVLTGTNYVDDGSVIYLNGTEIARFNMPAGPVAFDTLAPAANPGGFPNVNAGEPVLVQLQIPLGALTNSNPNPLVTGVNHIAIEVHQNSATSSDRVFGLALYGQQAVGPCTDGIQPTNRTITVRRDTTFTVVQCPNSGIPAPSIQWYRNVGNGEEIITGATAASYTLTNASAADAGSYYARLTNPTATIDSRQGVLVVGPDNDAPRFLAASVGSGLNTFRLTTDEQLCGDSLACGSDYTFQFNWQINQSDNLGIDLGVATITQINPTTYEFTTSSPRDPSKRYQITVTPIFGEVSDLGGIFTAPGTFAETGLQLTFQQGDANGYSGTQDTGLHSGTGIDTPAGADAIINVDGDDGGIRQALLRFDDIFGNAATQVPPGATITSATLTLNQTDNGNVVDFHRMLVGWDQNTATWNLLGGGLTADGTEATTAIEAVTPGLNGVVGPIQIDVTTSVRAWANGAANLGWALLPTGGDGWRWNSSESGVGTAPLLAIEFAPAVCSGAPVIRTQPPGTVNISELSDLSITVGVSNVCTDTTYQWTKNNVNVSGATSPTLEISGARPSDSGTYRLVLSSPRGNVTSSPAAVTVSPKTTRPHVSRVVSSANGTTITVQFSEAVSTASAQSTANYVLTPSVAVSGAVLGANNTVTLTTAARSVATSYSLRISGVTDTAQTPNVIDPNPTTVVLTSSSIVAGTEWASTWLYNSNNLDSTAGAWKTTGYTPGADWGSGPGLFGIETGAPLTAAPAPIGTALSANSVAPGDQLTTTYFRKSITLPALPAGARYVVCHYTDDGFIAYLDGTEVHRYGMPSGAVTFTNRSSGIPTGEATMRSFQLNTTAGTHLLAVELHQAGTTSSDVLMGMEVHVVGGALPALSISKAAGGPVNLSWSADATWQLRGAATVTGPYNNITVPAANRVGTYSIPAASATNNFFYLLDYICLP